MSKKIRRQFTPEFKANAVALFLENGQPVPQVGTGALTSGQSDTAQFGFDTGDGAVGGASVQYDPSSQTMSMAKGFAGISGGVWGGALTCRTQYYCVRDNKSDPEATCK